MKLIALFMFIATSAFAFSPPAIPDAAALKAKSAKVFKVCKEDKAKVKGCESYTELEPLKACLLKNKEALSAPCKTELTSLK